MIFCNKAQLSTAAKGPCTAIRASLFFSSEITYGPGLSVNKQHSICRIYFRETDSPYRPWLTEKVMYMRVRRLERELDRDCDSRSAHTRQLLIPRSALCHARHTRDTRPCTCLQWSPDNHWDMSNHKQGEERFFFYPCSWFISGHSQIHYSYQKHTILLIAWRESLGTRHMCVLSYS